jgi:hypothetical protein
VAHPLALTSILRRALLAVVALAVLAPQLASVAPVLATSCYARSEALFASAKNFARNDVAITEAGATVKGAVGDGYANGTRTWDAPAARLCAGDQVSFAVRAGGQLALLSRVWSTTGNVSARTLEVGLNGYAERSFLALPPGGDLGGTSGSRTYTLVVAGFPFAIGVWVRSSQGDNGLIAWNYVAETPSAATAGTLPPPEPNPPPAPATPPPPVSAKVLDPDQSLRDAFRGCPGSFDAYTLLRQMNADGRLVTDPSQSALADFWPRSSVVGGFLDKLDSAVLGIDTNDELGWLLTENATPRYPSNPYVQVTRDRQQLEDGELSISFESSLANRIATSAGNLLPNHVLKLALETTHGDYPLAMLTMHNLLKELTYASREPNGGNSALLGWNAEDRGTGTDVINASHAGYDVHSPVEVQALIGKLSNLREANDPARTDKMGPWYHLYGVLFVGSVTSGTEATLGAWSENFTRWLKLGSAPDPTKEFINACAGQLARYVANLPPQTSK